MDAITILASISVKSLLEGIISNAVGSLFANIATDKFRNQQEQRAALKAMLTATFETYFLAIIRSLQAQDYDEQQIFGLLENYREPLKTWLRDKQVTDELLRPFVEVNPPKKLNSALLQARWNALNVQELPEDWDMDFVCRTYLKRLAQERVVTPELRNLLTTQLHYQSTLALQAIRGVWHDFNVDQYAERVKKKYHVLDLSATATHRDDNDAIPLKSVFIPQSVKRGHPPRELPKEISTRDMGEGLESDEEVQKQNYLWRKSEPEPVLPVIAKERLLVVLGDPGAGKSTLARYVLLSVLEPPPIQWVDEVDAAGEPIKICEASWLDGFRERLPFLVELRNYLGTLANQTCSCFLSYLHHLGRSEGYALNYQELQEHLHSRPALFIFDGLDEIFDPSQRATMIEQIIGFATAYPKTQVMVTSRIIGYEGHNLRHAGFVEYTLQDLDETQIFTFARGWFNLVFADQPDEIEFRWQRVKRAVTESSAIQQLAGNPLLLTMIAMIAKHQELPRDRAKLYDNATRVLCHQWDATRHQLRYEHKTVSLELNEEDKLTLLRQLAWQMQSSPKGLAGNFITGDELENAVVTYLKGERFGLSQPDALSFGRAVIAQLRERNFILCLYGANVYGFVHRTFLEYFCAVYQVHCFEKTRELSLEQLKAFFKQRAKDEIWHEVLRLICGMIQPKFACELVETLLSPSEFENLIAYNKVGFVQDCIHEVPSTNPNMQKISQRLFDELIKFIRDMQKHPFFRGKAVRILAWNYNINPEILQLMRELMENSKENPLVRIEAIDRLACYPRDSEIFALLKQFAINFQEGEMERAAAIRGLAKNYRVSSEILSLLKTLAQDSKENERVRDEAICGLAKNYKSNPDVYDWLQQFLPTASLSSQTQAVSGWDTEGYNIVGEKEIDNALVQRASTALNLSGETVRRCYEHLAKEYIYPKYKLSWLPEQSAD